MNGKEYRDTWKELPCEWIKGLNIDTQVSSQKYIKKNNKYNVKCGSTLLDWNKSGWIEEIDPYGWFMWYCRFYLGRRSYDDNRQIKRYNNFSGTRGRWRNNLCKKITDKIKLVKKKKKLIKNYMIIVFHLVLGRLFNTGLTFLLEKT